MRQLCWQSAEVAHVIWSLAYVASWTPPWLPQEPYKQQLEPMLVRYVLPTFGSPAGHLRAKAAWVAGQFADIRFRERPGEGALLPRGAGATFQGLFQSVLGLLRDADLPVSCLVTIDMGRLHATLLVAFVAECLCGVLLPRDAGATFQGRFQSMLGLDADPPTSASFCHTDEYIGRAAKLRNCAGALLV